MSQHKEKFLSRWQALQIGQSFWIVDDLTNEEFWIVDIDDLTLEARPQNNIKITKQAFVEVIDYLFTHNHYKETPCEIRKGDSYEQSLPIVKVVQEANPHMKQSALSYVLAILKATGIVDISGVKPYTAWLIRLENDAVSAS